MFGFIQSDYQIGLRQILFLELSGKTHIGVHPNTQCLQSINRMDRDRSGIASPQFCRNTPGACDPTQPQLRSPCVEKLFGEATAIVIPGAKEEYALDHLLELCANLSPYDRGGECPLLFWFPPDYALSFCGIAAHLSTFGPKVTGLHKGRRR